MKGHKGVATDPKRAERKATIPEWVKRQRMHRTLPEKIDISPPIPAPTTVPIVAPVARHYDPDSDVHGPEVTLTSFEKPMPAHRDPNETVINDNLQ